MTVRLYRILHQARAQNQRRTLSRRTRLWLKPKGIELFVIPTEVEGSHGTMVLVFVIPTEVEGPHGTIEIEEGVICALRHIHVDPENALRLAVRDQDFVRIQVEGERSLIFGDVLVRVKPSYKLEMHVDTDEGNAAELTPGAEGFLDSIQSRRN